MNDKYLSLILANSAFSQASAFVSSITDPIEFCLWISFGGVVGLTVTGGSDFGGVVSGFISILLLKCSAKVGVLLIEGESCMGVLAVIVAVVGNSLSWLSGILRDDSPNTHNLINFSWKKTLIRNSFVTYWQC